MFAYLAKFKVFTLMITGVLLMAGCVSVLERPTYTILDFKAAQELNPDINNKPSPVVVNVFELASRNVFDSTDFFDLYEDPDAILKGDLVSKKELQYWPGQMNQVKLSLNEDTRFIAVVAAYRDIDNARWRTVISADPRAYDQWRVSLEKLSVYFKEM